MGDLQKKPAVIVISSHVARGSVGNRAAVFALEAFGFPVWAVPTVVLPWHPGHGPSTRLEHDRERFDKFMDDLSNAPWIGEVGAVLTGYMANEDQVSSVARLIKNLKQRDPSILHLCDPVIGDNGGLYVPEQTAIAVRDHLVPQCDIATPNSFELAWLSAEEELSNLGATVKLAEALVPDTVFATSVPANEQGLTGNLLATQEQVWGAFHPVVSDPPNGPGDLTAAVFLAHQLSGESVSLSLSKTTASVYEILIKASSRGSDELALESDMTSLLNPETDVPVSLLEGETA